MHSLLKVVAGKIATDNWMEMGARNRCDAANAALISRFFREWGIGIARGRAHAFLALHRDTFGGGGSYFLPPSLGAAIRRAKAPTSGARARACSHPSETVAPRKCFQSSTLRPPITIPSPGAVAVIYPASLDIALVPYHSKSLKVAEPAAVAEPVTDAIF